MAASFDGRGGAGQDTGQARRCKLGHESRNCNAFGWSFCDGATSGGSKRRKRKTPPAVEGWRRFSRQRTGCLLLVAPVVIVIVMRVVVVVRRDEDASGERRADERGEKGECGKAFQENLRSFSLRQHFSGRPDDGLYDFVSKR